MAEKEEEKEMQKIIRCIWFWIKAIKDLFKKTRDAETEMAKLEFNREYKKTRRIRKLTRLSRKINRGKNKGKTQRRHK